MSTSTAFITEELQNADLMGESSSRDTVIDMPESHETLDIPSDLEDLGDIENEEIAAEEVSLLLSVESDEESQQPLAQISAPQPKSCKGPGPWGVTGLLGAVLTIYTFVSLTDGSLDEDLAKKDCLRCGVYMLSLLVGIFMFVGSGAKILVARPEEDPNDSNGDLSHALQFEEWLKIDDEYNFEDRFDEIKELLENRYGSNANQLINKLEEYFQNKGYISSISRELLSAPISMGNKRYNKADIYSMIRTQLPEDTIFMDRSYTFRNPMGNRESIVFQFKNLQIDTEFRDIIVEDFNKIEACLEKHQDKSLQELDKKLQKVLGAKFSSTPCEEKPLEKGDDELSESSQGSPRLSR